jgi:hypothetical protein
MGYHKKEPVLHSLLNAAAELPVETGFTKYTVCDVLKIVVVLLPAVTGGRVIKNTCA